LQKFCTNTTTIKSTQVSIFMKFCEELYESCKSAEYMGKTIGREYKTGREFCSAQDFTIIENTLSLIRRRSAQQFG
jgi:hypothetical protein